MLGSAGCALDHATGNVEADVVRGAQTLGAAALRPGPDAFTETIPKTLVSLDFARVAIPVTSESAGDATRDVWFGVHEVSWDAYDAFVFRLDEPEDELEPDAIVRPSQPYVLADYGFGRAGYPVISVSADGAQAFCDWLSLRTGHRYRLPTVVEWEAAARAGMALEANAETDADTATGASAETARATAWLAGHAWLRDDADRRTHPRGARAADAQGLHDMFGNAAEWCLVDGGEPVLKGGSFQTPRAELLASDGDCASWLAERTSAWSLRDPQLPKSKWWLSDAPFAGFRVVCDSVAVHTDSPSRDDAADTPASNPAPTEDDR